MSLRCRALIQLPSVHVQMDKHTLVARLGIPYRDLRQMDPFIPQPYPSAILVRERAIVLSLENIRVITGKARSDCYRLRLPAVRLSVYGSAGSTSLALMLTHCRRTSALC